MPHRNRTIFVHAVRAHRELLIAGAAAPQKAFVARASLAVQHLINLAAVAMGAARVFAPTLFFEKLHGCGFIHACPWKFRDDCRFVRSDWTLSFCHDPQSSLILSLSQV